MTQQILRSRLILIRNSYSDELPQAARLGTDLKSKALTLDPQDRYRRLQAYHYFQKCDRWVETWLSSKSAIRCWFLAILACLSISKEESAMLVVQADVNYLLVATPHSSWNWPKPTKPDIATDTTLYFLEYPDLASWLASPSTRAREQFRQASFGKILDRRFYVPRLKFEFAWEGNLEEGKNLVIFNCHSTNYDEQDDHLS